MWSYAKITAWAVIWLILLAVFFVFTRHGRNNCLSWAMHKYDTEGGYLVIRWSRSNRFKGFAWPHFLWLDGKHQDKLQHYVPVEDEHTEKFAPHPWFEGRVKTGDKEEDRTDEN